MKNPQLPILRSLQIHVFAQISPARFCQAQIKSISFICVCVCVYTQIYIYIPFIYLREHQRPPEMRCLLCELSHLPFR